jgi:hypothetical protein
VRSSWTPLNFLVVSHQTDAQSSPLQLALLQLLPFLRSGVHAVPVALTSVLTASNRSSRCLLVIVASLLALLSSGDSLRLTGPK